MFPNPIKSDSNSSPHRDNSTILALKLASPCADRTGERDDEALRQACETFEGFLVGELLKTMRQAGVGNKGILSVNRGEQIFIGQQCEALGAILAQRQPLGIASLLHQALTHACSQLEGQEP